MTHPSQDAQPCVALFCNGQFSLSPLLDHWVPKLFWSHIILDASMRVFGDESCLAEESRLL